MTATRVAKASTLVVLVAGWALAAWLLARTTIPGNLHEPHVAAAAEFPARLLHRSAHYDGVLRWLWVAGTIVTLATLVLFALLGPRIARAWQLGRVGTGIMVGTVTTLGTWAVGLPIGAIALWWGRRYHLERQGYVSWALEQWPSLVSQVVGLTIALTILLLLAGRFGRRWWLVAAPLFTAARSGAGARAAVRRDDRNAAAAPHARERAHPRARPRGGGGQHADPDPDGERPDDGGERLHHRHRPLRPCLRLGHASSTAASATARSSSSSAHEFGHVAHRHIWKGLAWSLLLTAPAFLVVEWATRRRGGLERPEVVPFALLVLALIGLVITPFGNAVSRRYEAEADWSALRATHDPAAAESLFRKFTRYDLVQPNPPLWSYVLLDDHPTVVQRIALARAYRRARPLGVVLGRLGEVPDSLPGRPLRPRVLHRVEQLAHEAGRHVHAGDDDARDVAVLDLVVDARERERELVVREADVREVRVDAGEVLRVEWMLSWRSWPSPSTRPRYYARGRRRSALRRIGVRRRGHRRRRRRRHASPSTRSLARERGSQSIYRTTVTISLDGARHGARQRHGPRGLDRPRPRRA